MVVELAFLSVVLLVVSMAVRTADHWVDVKVGCLEKKTAVETAAVTVVE